jgi:hypothetical protein
MDGANDVLEGTHPKLRIAGAAEILPDPPLCYSRAYEEEKARERTTQECDAETALIGRDGWCDAEKRTKDEDEDDDDDEGEGERGRRGEEREGREGGILGRRK